MTFVSVPASFLFTLLHKKGRGTGFSWTPEFLVLSPLSRGWCAGKIQQLCALGMEPPLHTHHCLKNPGASARFQVLEEMLLLESCCFAELLPACLPPLGPVVVSKFNEEVTGEPISANCQHPLDTAGLLKLRILATYVSMTQWGAVNVYWIILFFFLLANIFTLIYFQKSISVIQLLSRKQRFSFFTALLEDILPWSWLCCVYNRMKAPLQFSDDLA